MGLFLNTLALAQEPITEGARFTGHEREFILRNSNKFRVGLEFEFLVRDGLDYTDMLDNYSRAKSQNAIKFQQQWEHSVVRLCDALRQLLHYTNRKPSLFTDAISEIESVFFTMTEEDVIWLDENVVEELVPVMSTVKVVVSSSVKILQFIPANVLMSTPVWHNISGVTINQMNNVNKLVTEGLYGVSLQDAKKLLANLLGLLTDLDQYVKDKAHFLNTPPARNIDMVVSAGIDWYMEANPQERGQRSENKVEIVKRTHPVPTQWVQDVVFDASVIDGAELITKPLGIGEIRQVLDIMAPYIREIGGTSRSTGLHVNVSTDTNKFNPVKAITMLDLDFFQNVSPNSRVRGKYDERLMVENLTRMLSGSLESIAYGYLQGGMDGLIQSYERSVTTLLNAKGASVNLQHFLRNADVGSRRVEFRFFGGPGYENRTDEIFEDILNVLYVVAISQDGMLDDKTYVRNILRILDRATKRVNRPNEPDFNSLINRIRKETY